MAPAKVLGSMFDSILKHEQSQADIRSEWSGNYLVNCKGFIKRFVIALSKISSISRKKFKLSFWLHTYCICLQSHLLFVVQSLLSSCINNNQPLGLLNINCLVAKSQWNSLFFLLFIKSNKCYQMFSGHSTIVVKAYKKELWFILERPQISPTEQIKNKIKGTTISFLRAIK